MYVVKTGFPTSSRRFIPGMTVHAADCDSPEQFRRFVEMGHIVKQADDPEPVRESPTGQGSQPASR